MRTTVALLVKLRIYGFKQTVSRVAHLRKHALFTGCTGQGYHQRQMKTTRLKQAGIFPDSYLHSSPQTINIVYN
jgi:hypothetical protein